MGLVSDPASPRSSRLAIDRDGDVAIARITRPEKRNAIDDELLEDLHRFFSAPPPGARALVLTGEGRHFCAGLDLGEQAARGAIETMHTSRRWHAAFDAMQFGKVPVVAALQGGVVGGGLELASAAHVRVADETAFYALPEAQRGIFVGGGGSVRIGRIVGPGRLVELMLTGRTIDAAEGQALGLSHHLVARGGAMAKALDLARAIAGNASLSNYAVMHAIPRIADMSGSDGLFAESLIVALTLTGDEAQDRLRDFLGKRAPRLDGS